MLNKNDEMSPKKIITFVDRKLYPKKGYKIKI